MAWASRLFRYVVHSTPDKPMRVMRFAAMIPVGASGESAPALAPLPTMMAMRNAGMPAREAVFIAMGASSAAVANATVALIGNGFPAQGVSDNSGKVTLTIGKRKAHAYLVNGHVTFKLPSFAHVKGEILTYPSQAA